jgi:hypothetical protein
MADPLLGAPPENDDPRASVAMALRIFEEQPIPGPRLRRELRALPEDKGPPALLAWCESRGLLPIGRVSPALFGGALGLFSVHRRLLEAHRPRACGAPIVLWRGDPRYHREGWDWSKHTTGAFREKNVGGTHFTMMSPPHVDAIASDLREVAIERNGLGGSPP